LYQKTNFLTISNVWSLQHAPSKPPSATQHEIDRRRLVRSFASVQSFFIATSPKWKR